MVGQASYNGGPGVVILFIFAAIACGFAALCYAEFASKKSRSPASAYTYAYASFGELLAWIIGGTCWWNTPSATSLSRSRGATISPVCSRPTASNIPLHWTMDFRTAHLGFESVSEAMTGGGASYESLRAVCGAKDAARQLRGT
jgi:amino acid transporter